MITVLDLIGSFECLACQDLARPGSDHCTSCAGWREWGELPTTLASARAIAEECAEAAEADREVEADRALRSVTDRLVHLERRRAHLTA